MRKRPRGAYSSSSELAATLSFWAPGLGQLYAKAWWRGFVIVIASGALSALAWKELSPGALWAGRQPEHPALAALLWGFSLAVWLWNIRDASRVACRSSR